MINTASLHLYVETEMNDHTPWVTQDSYVGAGIDRRWFIGRGEALDKKNNL